jgi:hypothetical protein
MFLASAARRPAKLAKHERRQYTLKEVERHRPASGSKILVNCGFTPRRVGYGYVKTEQERTDA